MPETDSKTHVLMIDDDESYRTLYKDQLSEFGFRVTSAANKELGFDALGSKPDVILLDYTLPDGDGSEVAEEIRSRESEWAQEVPIFMLTQHNDVDKVADTISKGAQGYFVKQEVDIEDLVDEINRHIDN